MDKFIPKYLKILRIELEDLQSDIEFLIDKYKQRRKNEEITDYVFLENLAVLKNEICGISSFNKIIDSIDPADYEDIDGFIRDMKARFKKRIEECGLAQVIYPLIKRKLEKVHTYVLQTD